MQTSDKNNSSQPGEVFYLSSRMGTKFELRECKD